MSFNPPTVLQQLTPGVRNPTWITLGESNNNYYSGLDAEIFFNDLFVGQLVSLDYQLQENVLPLFAYSDFKMRRVVHGMRMVRGSFTIMFQQVNLFYQILNYLTGIILDEPTVKTPVTTTGTNLPDIMQDLGLGTPSNPASLVASLGVLNVADQVNFLTQLSSTFKSKYDISQLNIQKNTLWQLQSQKIQQWTQHEDSGNPQSSTGPLLSHLAKRLDPLYSRYETTQEGFDIKIVLGKPPVGSVITEFTSGLPIPPSYAEALTPAFNAFNNKDINNRIERALELSPPYTTRVVSGVRITGMAQQLDDSGRPITESYSFLAADII